MSAAAIPLHLDPPASPTDVAGVARAPRLALPIWPSDEPTEQYDHSSEQSTWIMIGLAFATK
jgi:hypothetical protein